MKYLLLLLLSGCMAAPIRSDVDAFKLRQAGVIAPEKSALFADCLMDGFMKAQYILQNIRISKDQRVDGLRVEMLTPNAILLSADILPDGHVALYESYVAGLINTTVERKSFSSCLEANK